MMHRTLLAVIHLQLLLGLGSVFAQNCTPPILDVLFILDSTPAVLEENHKTILKFVRTFVEKMAVSVDGTRVGLVQFTPSARPEFYANIYFNKQRLLTAIDQVPYVPCNDIVTCYGATSDNASVSYVTQLGLTKAVGNRPSIPDAAIFISTGAYRPLIRPPSINFSTPVSPRYVFTLQIGSDGNVTDYTVPFADGVSRLGANGYQYLQQLVEPLCEAVIKAVTKSGNFGSDPRDSFIGYPENFYPPGSGVDPTASTGDPVVGSASVFGSACAAPILIILIIAIIFLLILGFVIYHIRRRNKELEAKLRDSGQWAQKNITASSVQATHGPGSGFTRFGKDGKNGRRTEATQTPPGSMEREDSVEEEDILISSMGEEDKIRLINDVKVGKSNGKKETKKGQNGVHNKGVDTERSEVSDVELQEEEAVTVAQVATEPEKGGSKGQMQVEPGPSPRPSLDIHIHVHDKNVEVKKKGDPLTSETGTESSRSEAYQGARNSKELQGTPRSKEGSADDGSGVSAVGTQSPAKTAGANSGKSKGKGKIERKDRKQDRDDQRNNGHRDSIDSSSHDSQVSPEPPADPRPPGGFPSYLIREKTVVLSADARAPPRAPSITRDNDLSEKSNERPSKLSRVKQDRKKYTPKGNPKPSTSNVRMAETAEDSEEGSVTDSVAIEMEHFDVTSGDERDIRPIGDTPDAEQPPQKVNEETMTMEKSPGRKPRVNTTKETSKRKTAKVKPLTGESTKGRPGRFGFRNLKKQKTADKTDASPNKKKKKSGVKKSERVTISDTEVMEVDKETKRKVRTGKKVSNQRTISPNSRRRKQSDQIQNELDELEKDLNGRSVSVAEIGRELTEFMKRSSNKHMIRTYSPSGSEDDNIDPNDGSDGLEKEDSDLSHADRLRAGRGRKSPQPDNLSQITRGHPISVYKMPIGEWSSDNLKSENEAFDDGTLTPIFFRDLDNENKRHNPYSNAHLPSDHPALHLPPLDILFLVDNSGSIGNMNFQKIKDFLAKVSDDIYIAPKKSRMAIILFNIESTVYFSFEKFFSNPSAKRAIQRIPYSGGGTHLGKALDFAANFLTTTKKGHKKVATKRLQILAVISDGFTEDHVEPAAKNLHDTSTAKLAAIGVRNGDNMDKLEVLTRDPKGIFHLGEPEHFSNWIFKQQFEWQESIEAGKRADTAMLERVQRQQELALGLGDPNDANEDELAPLPQATTSV